MNHQDLINACRQDWLAYTQHGFIEQLAKGTLAHWHSHVTCITLNKISYF
tara:strand:- start:12 stop:161 length:150 start_codon:yes stop_codon:yes gene_type:complete